MHAPVDAPVRKRWTLTARALGVVSALTVFAVGILYVAVIATWLVVASTPSEPIGDPYLAAMEVLTIVSALGLMGVVLAVLCYADPEHYLPALAAVVAGSLAAGLTMTVHFVQLTAVRQLWRAGELLDYRLVWPSVLFGVEYFAWDILVGLAMVFTGCALAGERRSTAPRRVFLTGGLLCVAGAAGPLSGWMILQNVALVGYAVLLPAASALAARLFWQTNPPSGTTT